MYIMLVYIETGNKIQKNHSQRKFNFNYLGPDSYFNESEKIGYDKSIIKVKI